MWAKTSKLVIAFYDFKISKLSLQIKYIKFDRQELCVKPSFYFTTTLLMYSLVPGIQKELHLNTSFQAKVVRKFLEI